MTLPAIAMKQAATGLSVHLGWAATATIIVASTGLRILRTDRLELAPSDDREIREPYHIAGGFDGLQRVPQSANPRQCLEKGIQRQRRAAAQAIAELVSSLAADGCRIAVAGLLVSRGRAAATFERAIGSHTQIHIEEGIAVRESFRLALTGEGARVVDLDQKALWAEASVELGRAEAELLAELRALRPENGGSWRKEEQTAALAAWVAWGRGAD